MEHRRFTRRQVIGGALSLTALVTPVLAACSQQPQAASTPQVVEKVVTQVVEKQVPVTQVVEKQVTTVVEKVVTPTAGAVAQIGPAEISWWAWGNEDTGFKGWRKQIAIFNQKYPQVKVNLQPETGFDKVAVTIAAGTAADMLFINVPSGWAFIGHGGILDLQPYIRADKTWIDDIGTFAKMTIDSYTFRGDLFAIPQSLETSGTIYNEDMIVKAGLKTPKDLGDQWDWTKFMEYAQTLTKGSEGPDKVFGCFVSPDPQSGLGDFAYPLVNGTNNTWVNDDGVSTGIDSKEFLQSAQFLADFYTKKLSPTPSFMANNSAAASSAYALFDNEKVGMMVSGDWAFGWILTRQLPDKKFKMDWMTSPKAPNGQTSAVGHSVANAAYAKTKQRDAILAFLRMYSQKPMQDEITNNWDNYPALSPRSDAQSYFWEKKLIPNADALKKSYDMGKPYPHTPVGDATPLVITPVNNAMNQVIDGKDNRKLSDILGGLAKKINGDLAKAAENSKA